LGVTQVR